MTNISLFIQRLGKGIRKTVIKVVPIFTHVHIASPFYDTHSTVTAAHFDIRARTSLENLSASVQFSCGHVLQTCPQILDNWRTSLEKLSASFWHQKLADKFSKLVRQFWINCGQVCRTYPPVSGARNWRISSPNLSASSPNFADKFVELIRQFLVPKTGG
ncbi:unnamed protein product [Notodromas monacha]|uniref:Uncharacterized protein n=1 Tax=Notodromas monacha TaxID=399045 RepID=A0A7R9BVB9_9CRUS|nr:unnamed protein product [Notodromas monacha]CAG0922418.1 unnamed protein product [Notodromas monacha]